MAWRYKRNIERSLLRYIWTNLQSDWTNVNVALSFNYETHTLPHIFVRLDSGTHSKLELGNTKLNPKELAIIDIYATGDGQRLDLAAYLLDKLSYGFIYYEFSPNPSNPGELIKVANGWVYVNIVGDIKVPADENDDTPDKFRHRITLELERNKK